MLTALILVSVLLSLNMGVSGYAVSFAPSYGSQLVTRKLSVILFLAGVILGAMIIGPRVVETLSSRLTQNPLNVTSGFIVLSTCTLALVLSNYFKVPQSTSFVTVASFVGMGLYYGSVSWNKVMQIFYVAILFSFFSFFITYYLQRKMYPPRMQNLKFYEKFHLHRSKFQKWVIGHDVYAAFGVGSNNVANVVAPICTATAIVPVFGLLMMAPFFALGAYFFGEKMIRSLSKDIVPLGEISASIVSFTTATFVLLASIMGLPAPYAQFSTFALLGVSCAKNGVHATFSHNLVKRVFWIWLVVPLLTTGLSYMLHVIFQS